MLSRRVWYLCSFYHWQLGTFMQNFHWRYFTSVWNFFRCCKMLIFNAYNIYFPKLWIIYGPIDVFHTSCARYCVLFPRIIAVKEFSTNTDVKQAVAWLKTLNSDFFHALVSRRYKYWHVSSDCLKVWCVPSVANFSCVYIRIRFSHQTVGYIIFIILSCVI